LQPFDITEVWTLDFPEGESIAAIGRRPQNGTKLKDYLRPPSLPI